METLNNEETSKKANELVNKVIEANLALEENLFSLMYMFEDELKESAEAGKVLFKYLDKVIPLVSEMAHLRNEIKLLCNKKGK